VREKVVSDAKEEKRPEPVREEKMESFGEKVSKMKNSIRFRKAQRIASLKRSKRFSLGKFVLFLAFLVHIVLMLINYLHAVGGIGELLYQFPSAMRLNSWLEITFREVNASWPYHLRNGSLPLYRACFYPAVPSLLCVILMLPFTRYAVKRACSLMLLTLFVFTGLYIGNVITPILDSIYISMTIESSIVLMFRHLWPVLLAFAVILIVKTFAKHSIKNVAEYEKILSQNNGGAK